MQTRSFRSLIALVALVGASPLAGPPRAARPATTKPAAPASQTKASAAPGAAALDTVDTFDSERLLHVERTPWKGDLDGMLERRFIRFLVPYSRTLYFVDKGRERGVTAETARDFEHYLNTKYARKLGRRPVSILLVPTTRDLLLQHLADGLGDVAAGNLTATPERSKVADFVTHTDRKPVREVLVTGPDAPAIAGPDDLAGKTIDVRPSSSYYESLVELNARLRSEGRPPVKIARLPDALEDEDVLEMVNAGVVDLSVVDSWKVELWAKVLPRLKVRNDIVLRDEGYTGWAIRPGSPRLKAEIEAFDKKFLKRQNVIEKRLEAYEKHIKQISNNNHGAAMRRFEKTVALFRKYGAKYGFDPLMLTAQGYQESRLDQTARSQMGAIGVMQIMPATGAELRVGDIKVLEPNIHAGAKYMDQLMTNYFPDAQFPPGERPLFAFASYNAGPGNISRMRKLAGKRGLDPNRWFNNVELVVADKIGIETTTYVRNIYKYYVAYKLTVEAQEAQRKLRESVASDTS